jgi:putative membrane protein
MNTNTQSKHAIQQGVSRFPKLLSKPVAALRGMALLAVALLLAVPSAKAEPNLSSSDKAFIAAAAQGGMTEVKLGELAERKGTRDDVKAFGQMMVKDHTAINRDLKALAAKKKVKLPDSLDAKHQEMVDKMAVLKGSEFDNAYVADMIKDHNADAKEFKGEAIETKDTDLKSFVDTSLPIVEKHLKCATALKK